MNKRAYLPHYLLLFGIASWVVSLGRCLRCFVGSSTAVAMLQGPNLQAAGNRWHHHLPPFPRCQLEPDIPNCYDFLKSRNKGFRNTFRFVVLLFISCFKDFIITVLTFTE
jgi:hypothetical protein